MTDLNLVANSFKRCVLAYWLAYKARKSEVPGSSHEKDRLFPVFADSKPAMTCV